MSTECFYPLGDDAVSSGLSEHSSDRLQLPQPSKPIAPGVTPVTVASKEEAGSEERDGREASDDDSDLLTPSASESTLVNGKPITSQDADTSSAKKELQEVYMYISYLYYICTCNLVLDVHV